MLARYGWAAIVAAFATLMGTVVWAQDDWPQSGCATGYVPPACCAKKTGCAAKDCCATSACCKDGKCGKRVGAAGTTGKPLIGACCKEDDCCCKNKKCDASCSCGKDNKCDCSNGGECCCEKGKCTCKGKGAGSASCPFLNKLAKGTAIIMVMPASLPLLGVCHPQTMGMLPHPPLPMVVQGMLPGPLPPPPPLLTPPGMPVPGMAAPPQCVPCPGQPVVLPAPCAMKANSPLDTCLSLLDVASELCSRARPLNAPSLCMAALGLLMEASPSIGYSMPEPSYLTHPPQYMPPSPPFPLARELAQEATAAPSCGGASCCPVSVCAGMPPCDAPCIPGTLTPAAKVRILATPSEDTLEMNVGETCVHCKKMTVKIGDNEISVSRFDDRVRVRGEELKATADCVCSDRKDRLILEGDVVLHYKKDGHSANVTGDRIELNLSSGAVTIKPAANPSDLMPVRVHGGVQP